MNTLNMRQELEQRYYCAKSILDTLWDNEERSQAFDDMIWCQSQLSRLDNPDVFSQNDTPIAV